jgi:hypothetical protein
MSQSITSSSLSQQLDLTLELLQRRLAARGIDPRVDDEPVRPALVDLPDLAERHEVVVECALDEDVLDRDVRLALDEGQVRHLLDAPVADVLLLGKPVAGRTGAVHRPPQQLADRLRPAVLVVLRAEVVRMHDRVDHGNAVDHPSLLVAMSGMSNRVGWRCQLSMLC